VGWPLLLAGLGLVVRAAAGVDLQRPRQLVLRGPYAFSRNPRYVAATVAYAGIALVANATWPLLLPGVLLATHVVAVREERFLEGRFGTAYRSYNTSSADTCEQGRTERSPATGPLRNAL
jgi:protein-S-isoprenylcysteine O-methyltransferase Ste14